jgi:hypothetical protein
VADTQPAVDCCAPFHRRWHGVATEAEFVAFSADQDEAGLFGDPLRGGVLDVTREIEPPESKFARRPLDQRSERA